MKILFSLLLTVSVLTATAQSSEEDAIKATINQLFSGMHKSDTNLLSGAFTQTALLQTIVSKNGQVEVRVDPVSGFIRSIGSAKAGSLDERIEFGSILIDGPMAMVWTPYKFYVEDRFSHCGVNCFQLVKLAEGWKIQSVIDTRRKDACP
ncbi:MAG TPA: nuclear transport factor 2 family protein [Flavihumibacter sp.]